VCEVYILKGQDSILDKLNEIDRLRRSELD
jgi:hypothetical protein